MPKVPARYIGDSPRILKEADGRHLDGDGKPLSSYLITAGQTLMVPDTEVFGFTYKHDPRGVEASRFMGLGRVIAPEHTDLDPVQLRQQGYEFHEGRTDFEPLVELPRAEGSVELPPLTDEQDPLIDMTTMTEDE